MVADLLGLSGTAQPRDPLESRRCFGFSGCTQDMVFVEALVCFE